MEYRDLIARVARELPFPGADGPERAVEATLKALFEAIPRQAARSVLGALPGAPSGLVSASPPPAPSTRASLWARAAELLAEPQARAMEQAQVVCAALDRALTGEDRAALVRSLPEDLRVLFEPRVEQTPAAGVETGHGHTLADGAPGSAHSLSEDVPGSRHPLSAARPAGRQEHSVAEANPHGDTKLSSARGLTQEREHESLGEGRSKRS